jgi:tetratricopeptide (TPR) repeat protein
MDTPGRIAIAALIEEARQHRALGELQESLAQFRKAAELDPRNPGIRIEIARDLRTLCRLDDAEAELAPLLAADPGNVGALVERGHLRRARRDHVGALASFEAAAAGDPARPAIRTEVARELRALGRIAAADGVLTAILAADSRNLGALVERGHLRRAAGDREGALAAFREAGTLDPEHAGISLEAAAELRALGRKGEAEGELRRLWARVRDATTSVALANFLMDKGAMDEAEAVLREARDRDGSDIRIVRSLAHLAHCQGDADGRLAHLRAAAAIAPGRIDIRFELAACLREAGEIAEARQNVEAGLAVQPGSVAGWLQLGLIGRAARDPDQTRMALERALALDPESPQVLVEMARDCWAAGQPTEAAMHLGQALARDPNHLTALMVGAEQALVAEDASTALGFAERAVAAAPDQLGPILLAARAAAMLCDRAMVERLLAEARQRFGDLPEIGATHIHILRLFRDFAGGRAVLAAIQGDHRGHFGLWLEQASLALSLGNFAAVEAALASAPARSPRERARVLFLSGQLAEARRDYRDAARRYSDAIAIDPGEAGWHGEAARASLLHLDLEGAAAHLDRAIARAASARRRRGLSLNRSQHHVGQLLDEFSLDGPLLDRLRDADRLAGQSRIDALRNLVRQNPDSTAAALMLVLAVRQAGGFVAPRRGFRLFAAPAIPRQVVQFWDDEDPPPEVEALVASWRQPGSGFRHHLFNDASAEALLRANAPAAVLRAFRRASHPAQRADVFRLAYLAHSGGIYADADDRLAAPLSRLAPPGTSLVAYQENYGTIANNLIAAAPRHPVVLRALDLATAAINRGDGDTIWLSTGPGLMTRAFAQSLAEGARWTRRALVLELFEAQWLVEIHCPAAYKQTDRHWSRQTSGVPDNRRPRDPHQRDVAAVVPVGE